MNKNAIVIVGTGRYSILALRLINNIFAHYVGQSHLDIHLFSDQKLDKFFINKTKDRVSLNYHKVIHESWNKSASQKLKSLECFNYKNYEYISCLDADSNIKSDFMENNIFRPLFAMRHVNKVNPLDSFENNDRSTAYLIPGDRKNYYQSDYFGATAEIFNEMVSEAKLLQQIDFNNGISSEWADEAYLQPYLNRNNAFMFDGTDNDFPIEMGNKGVVIGKSGKNIDFFALWDDKLYYKMLSDARKMILNDRKWDIINGEVVECF